MAKAKATKVRAPKTNAKDDAEMMGLRMIANALSSRSTMFGGLGTSFGGARNLYTECGYPQTLTFSHYWNRFERQDVATRVINAYPDAAWKNDPAITDDEGATVSTRFEDEWTALQQSLEVYSQMTRHDVLTGIGQYGVLFIGFDDAANDKGQAEPVVSATPKYLKPFKQSDAEVIKTVTDTTDPRFGLPEMYKLKLVNPETQGETGLEVHWTRVIHSAFGTLSEASIGMPKLQPVYNRLQDLETTVAGSTEMFWRGGFPGYAINADPEAELQDADEMKDSINKFFMGLQRYIRTQGIDIKALQQQIADPKSQVDVLITLISVATGIPKRILTGSEQAQLASGQDRLTWQNRVETYQTKFIEPQILNPFVDRMILVGALSEPKEGQYTTIWTEDDATSGIDKANAAKANAEALSAYLGGGVSALVPPVQFLVKFMGMTKKEAEDLVEFALQDVLAETRQAEEDEAAIAAQDNEEE